MKGVGGGQQDKQSVKRTEVKKGKTDRSVKLRTNSHIIIS